MTLPESQHIGISSTQTIWANGNLALPLAIPYSLRQGFRRSSIRARAWTFRSVTPSIVIEYSKYFLVRCLKVTAESFAFRESISWPPSDGRLRLRLEVIV